MTRWQALTLALLASVDYVLGGSVKDKSWTQVTLTLLASCLGLRESTGQALPASIASRVVSHAPVVAMAEHAVQARLLTMDTMETFKAHYDRRTNDAIQRFDAMLPDAERKSFI